MSPIPIGSWAASAEIPRGGLGHGSCHATPLLRPFPRERPGLLRVRVLVRETPSGLPGQTSRPSVFRWARLMLVLDGLPTASSSDAGGWPSIFGVALFGAVAVALGLRRGRRLERRFPPALPAPTRRGYLSVWTCEGPGPLRRSTRANVKVRSVQRRSVSWAERSAPAAPWGLW
jgi:hypothetical protein